MQTKVHRWLNNIITYLLHRFNEPLSPSFSSFSSFTCKLTLIKWTFIIKIAQSSIWTWATWGQKRPLCQLHTNHISSPSDPILQIYWLSLQTLKFFLKNGPNPASFLFIFVLFSHHMDKYSTNLTIIEKVLMACLGVEPGASGWKVQTNPLSYGGTP